MQEVAGQGIMALIKAFEEKRRDRQSIHDAIDATYSVFERDGRALVQIDTYGRAEREVPGKVSQSTSVRRKIRARVVRHLEGRLPLPLT